jgi:hypothetical protein
MYIKNKSTYYQSFNSHVIYFSEFGKTVLIVWYFIDFFLFVDNLDRLACFTENPNVTSAVDAFDIQCLKLDKYATRVLVSDLWHLSFVLIKFNSERQLT